MTSQMIWSLVLLYWYQVRASSSRTILGGFLNPKLPKSVDEVYFTILIVFPWNPAIFGRIPLLSGKKQKHRWFYALGSLATLTCRGDFNDLQTEKVDSINGTFKQVPETNIFAPESAWLENEKIYFWGPAYFQVQLQGVFRCKLDSWLQAKGLCESPYLFGAWIVVEAKNFKFGGSKAPNLNKKDLISTLQQSVVCATVFVSILPQKYDGAFLQYTHYVQQS